MLKKVVPHSVATALASSVFPVPGGPYRRMPCSQGRLAGCLPQGMSTIAICRPHMQSLQLFIPAVLACRCTGSMAQHQPPQAVASPARG